MDSKTETDPFPDLSEGENEDAEAMEPHCQKHCVHLICLLMMQDLDHEDFLARLCVCKNPEDLAKMPNRPKLGPGNFKSNEIEPWIVEVERRNAADEHSKPKYGERILQIFYEDVRDILDYWEKVMRATTPDNDNFRHQMDKKYKTQADKKCEKAIDDFVREIDYFFFREFLDRDYLTIGLQTLLNVMKHMIKNIISDWAKEESASSFRDIHKKKFKDFPKEDQSASAALCHFWKSRMERLIGLLAWRNNEILKDQSS